MPPLRNLDEVGEADADEADVVVIGAGIAGASIAHRCAKSGRRVVLLEQYDHSAMVPTAPAAAAHDTAKDEGDPDKVLLNRGSSRGGPRRMGTAGAGKRGREAWDAWRAMNDSIVKINRNGGGADFEDEIWDVSGEVYVFALFPYGWMFLAFAALWRAYALVLTDQNAIPRGFKFLLTPGAIRGKLGARQGFGSSWSGCVGIYHDEAAVLHPDKIFRHLLKESDNYEVRFGSRAIDVELIEPKDSSSPSIVEVAVSDCRKGNPRYRLRCNHLVVACGAWTGEILRRFYQRQRQEGVSTAVDPDVIRAKVEVFTCPVYRVEGADDGKGNVDADSPPPPFTLESGCPIFSCVTKGVYGFPVNHSRLVSQKNGESFLSLRPFRKSHDSEDPDNRRISEEQKAGVEGFAKECLAENGVSYSHCYTCRYPKLSLDGGKSYRPVFDFIPGSNGLITVVAGLDGYGFKFGSVYGREFLGLLETGRGPEGMEWPSTKEGGSGWGRAVGRWLRVGFVSLIEGVFTSRKEQAANGRYKEE